MPLEDPQLSASGFEPVAGDAAAARFTVAAGAAAAQLAFWEAPRLAGRFSENAVSRLLVRASAVPYPFKKKDTRIVLEDGSVWHGVGFGAKGTQIGEVVFNTSMMGYQEIMTDPSYKGQFVVFTHPHIGNTGINEEDLESSKCHLGAIIVRDLSCVVSNYRSTKTLSQYCEEQNVIGISDLDTRSLTKRLRETGCLVGAISTEADKSDAELLAMAKNWTIVGKDLLSVVSCTEPYEWKDATDSEWEFNANTATQAGGKKFTVVAYDFGIKQNILRRLASFGCKIIVVPATYPADKVLALNPDGVFFSNGPGDPSAAPYAVENAKAILGKKPVFGICMGHQLLGQAFGGKTFKLKFGHHGGNHPIRYNPTGRVEISAQNHNFAVDPATLPAGVEVTHINLNDGTCAGMVYPAMKAMTIQYHPEASPGPHDADICFEQFVDMMKEAAVPVKA
ncbi:carbamoyl-phosphate synthase S chain [Raphidocelis subcapitata]|uniref:Carbamoyl phosphate synthase small chain, chloroplastic n=1 Tax=Raphidocelis subcapitata TaxID=307507 RepID=A0A2V0P8R1_9CHLO|nr:carbamoyl-phosphate synthase S chain [Raphidocelis subcapitata]|eukprot:GBF96248.1 carbamoyl-phosphate synthase S chain [Raphidocelis subcapitata]